MTGQEFFIGDERFESNSTTEEGIGKDICQKLETSNSTFVRVPVEGSASDDDPFCPAALTASISAHIDTNGSSLGALAGNPNSTDCDRCDFLDQNTAELHLVRSDGDKNTINVQVEYLDDM